MAFRPLKMDSGKTLSVLATNASTFTKYGGVKFTSGLAVVAASGDAELALVSLEAKTIADTTTQLLCLRVDPSIPFEVDLSAAITITNVGTCIDLNNSTTLDPAASTDDVFLITNLVPENTSKAIGYFQPAIAGRP